MVTPSDQAATGGADRQKPPTLNVNVVFMGELQRWAGRREVDVALPAGSTVAALGERLLSLCGESFARSALTTDGAFQPHVAVFVNGLQIGRLNGTKTVLTGDRVKLMLLPTYEGG